MFQIQPRNSAKVGFERSPNYRWGDSRIFTAAGPCRLELKHPPTPVGGISKCDTAQGGTNGFSKKVENHMHAIALHYMHYNFVYPIKA